MAITKPAVRQSWANVAIPVTDIVDPGDPYVAAGWLESATPPSRQYFNWLLNYATNGVRYFSRRGVVDYDAAETYQIGDTVLGDLGILMQSLTAGNIGNLPSTSTVNWAPLKNYPNSTQVASAISTALAAYETTAALTATLANYVTTATLSATLAAYVTNTSLATTLTSYATLAALSLKSNTLSPTFTGVPAAPTATVGTNTTQLATTAFAQGVYTSALAAAQAAAIAYVQGLVRYGITATLAGGANTIAYASAFPTATDSVVVTPTINSATYAVTSWDKNGFHMNTGAAVPFFYIAYGH
jgi:hypothetical protein